MKKFAIRNCVIVFAMLFVGTAAYSQEASPVDFMRLNPNSALSNAAADSPYFGYFGMGFGCLSGALRNSGLFYDELFRFDKEGFPVALDLNAVETKLKDWNKLGAGGGVDVFSCGRRLKTGFITFSYRFRMQAGCAFSRDLVTLLAKGNSAFMGAENPADINVEIDAKAFSELNFGYQINLSDKLSLGARLKFLMGFANARSQSINMQLFTDPDSYAISVTDKIDLDVCLPNAFTFEKGNFKFSDGHFHFGSLFRNPGLGVDLGADYRFNEHFGVSAAVNDLGFIVWKRNAMHIKGNPQNAGALYHDGSVVFNGFDPHQLRLLVNDQEYRQQYLDTLSQYLGLEGEVQKYTTGLNTSMLLRGYYDIHPDHRATAQLQGWFTGIEFIPALTLAYNATFIDMFDLVATYTATPYCYTNFGLGVGMRFYYFYLYAATNNVVSVFDPANARQFNVHVGLMFTNNKVNRRKTVSDDEVKDFGW